MSDDEHIEQPQLPDEFQPRDAAGDDEPEVVCLADVPAEEWARYEAVAEELGEPPDTPAPRGTELV